MLLGADISYITLLTAEKGTARVEASDGHVSSFHVGMQIPHGAGSSDVLTTSAPFWSADYLSDARFPHHERLDEMVRAEELRGIMAVPSATAAVRSGCCTSPTASPGTSPPTRCP